MDDHQKRLGALAIMLSTFLYTFLCYFLSRIFRKIPNLQWEPEWAFIPLVNIYIITTKICHKSDVYFCCMGVATMITGIIGLLMWMLVLFNFGERFNHSKCWSFWLLFVFPFYGFVNIALDDDAYYRHDTPILEPPEAVFRRVTNPEYDPPDYFEESLSGHREPGDHRVHFEVLPGPGAQEPDIQIVEREEPSGAPKGRKQINEAISMSPTLTFSNNQQRAKMANIEDARSYSDSSSSLQDIV